VSDGTRLREEFLLDPSVTFLNHGSFGATPRAVFERYQEWQLELERQPVLFLARRLDALLAEARAALGAYLGADEDDLVFVPNATAGVNVAAWPLGLGPGDEVLSTDLEYGALDLTWEHVCGDFGARYVRTPIRLPVRSAEGIVAAVWSGVGPRTRALFLSHHTSTTAMTLPVAELCRRAREGGDPNHRRRRARTGTSPAELARARRRLLRRELPQVAVPFPQKACPRRWL
jgi:isopenicillin-N epimerase